MKIKHKVILKERCNLCKRTHKTTGTQSSVLNTIHSQNVKEKHAQDLGMVFFAYNVCIYAAKAKDLKVPGQPLIQTE